MSDFYEVLGRFSSRVWDYRSDFEAIR